MEARTYKPFGTSGAIHFISQVEEEGISKIYEAILQVTELPETNPLHINDCEQALAAIEFVAAAKGNPNDDFPEASRKWMKEKFVADILETDPDEQHKAYFDITEISRTAIERIQNNSQMRERCLENDHSDEWNQELENLKKRIS